MSQSDYVPGNYVKGDSQRVANSVSEAVALRFDGYKLVEAAETEVDAPVEPPAAPVTPEAPVPDRRPSIFGSQT